MPGWVVPVLIGALAFAGCSGGHRHLERALSYEQSDVPRRRLPDLAVPYRVNQISGKRGAFVFSNVHIPSPQGFEREPALYIPEIVLKMDYEAAGSAHVIRELIVHRPQMSIDWKPYGSNLDVLYYALLLKVREAAQQSGGEWVLDRFTIRGGFVSVPDKWLGRERLDIALEPFSADDVIDPDSPVSVEALTERCAALFIEAVSLSIASFDREMELLEQAVEANLAQYFSE